MSAPDAQPPETVDWRRLAVPAYAPTVVVSLGQGAVLPLVALSARELGAGVGTASFVVALLGLGQLAGDLPAGALATRIGERRALIVACLLNAVALVGAFLAGSLVLLGVAVLVAGMAGAVFGLARQAYLTEAVPLRMRARALSTLGGTARIGTFVGPFAGAAIVSTWNIGAAYAFAALVNLVAAGITAAVPDLTRGGERRAAALARGRRSVAAVLLEHRRTLATVGVGVLVISAARYTRQAIVPLWAQSQGLDAAQTSVIFGISAGVDMLLFYPGGAIMDRFGRLWTAGPAMIVMATGFALLPLTHDALTIGAVGVLLGLGNGISAGVVMTLGADVAPPDERTQFLGGWRLCSDLGAALGPLVVSGVAAVATLAVAAWAIAALTYGGTGWLARWVPRRPTAPRSV